MIGCIQFLLQLQALLPFLFELFFSFLVLLAVLGEQLDLFFQNAVLPGACLHDYLEQQRVRVLNKLETLSHLRVHFGYQLVERAVDKR